MNGLKRRIHRLERAAMKNQEGNQLRVIIRSLGETTEQCLSKNNIPADSADLIVIITKFSRGEPDYPVHEQPAAIADDVIKTLDVAKSDLCSVGHKFTDEHKANGLPHYANRTQKIRKDKMIPENLKPCKTEKICDDNDATIYPIMKHLIEVEGMSERRASMETAALYPKGRVTEQRARMVYVNRKGGSRGPL